MATTLATLRDDSLIRLGDADNKVWSTAEIEQYIQIGYNRFIYRTRFLWKSATLTDVAAQALYTLPADFLFIERATWNLLTMTPLKQAELASLDTTFESRTGNPQNYSIDGDGVLTLRKYPAPSANGSGDADTKIEYYYRGAVLDDATDVLQIPDVYAKTIRQYVIWKALEREGPGQDLAMAQHFSSRWAEGIGRVILRRNRTTARRRPSMGARSVRRRRVSATRLNVPEVIDAPS